MNTEDKLKSFIELNYKNIRQFSIESGIPYSTIDTVLKKGIQKAHVTSVIKICRALNISADALADGEICSINTAPAIIEHELTAEEAQLLADYRVLNDDAQLFFRRSIHDFASMDKYKKAAPAETA